MILTSHNVLWPLSRQNLMSTCIYLSVLIDYSRSFFMTVYYNGHAIMMYTYALYMYVVGAELWQVRHILLIL